MGKFGGTPAAPDPYKVASTESNFNRLNTYNPGGGGTMYGYTDPTTGGFVAGTPPQGAQSAVATQESEAQKAMREMMTPASLDLMKTLIGQNMTGLPGPARPQDTSQIASTMYDRNVSMMMPTIERTNSRLINNLQARGIPIGGDAFNEAYGNQQMQTQDTLARTAQDATLAAGQEQSRQFGMDSSARAQALSEIAAMMGGGYNAPTNAPPPQAQGVNYGGIAQQGYQNSVAQSQQQAQTMSSLGSLAGSMLMKCSMEAKDIHCEADTYFMADVVAGLPIAAWSYKPEQAPHGMGTEDHVGPMAEHFHAATGLGDGKTINVIDAVGVLFGALQSALLRIQVLERMVYGDEVH